MSTGVLQTSAEGLGLLTFCGWAPAGSLQQMPQSGASRRPCVCERRRQQQPRLPWQANVQTTGKHVGAAVLCTLLLTAWQLRQVTRAGAQRARMGLMQTGTPAADSGTDTLPWLWHRAQDVGQLRGTMRPLRSWIPPLTYCTTLCQGTNCPQRTALSHCAVRQFDGTNPVHAHCRKMGRLMYGKHDIWLRWPAAQPACCSRTACCA